MVALRNYFCLWLIGTWLFFRKGTDFDQAAVNFGQEFGVVGVGGGRQATEPVEENMPVGGHEV